LELRHCRLHRQLLIKFDAQLTLIEGANETGKSTLAEAIHRAMFLPARSSGAAQEALRAVPFLGDPELELRFAAGGQTYSLRKRFAGPRGSVSLSDGSGVVLQGDPAEERLAQLVGAAAVKGGNQGKLRERWGHLWVWQGSAGTDPLGLVPEALDQQRLLEQLQAGGTTALHSPLDRRVLEAVRQRWGVFHTDKGRLGRAGSSLAAAQQEESQASAALEQLEGQLRNRQEALLIYDAARQELNQLESRLPLALELQELGQRHSQLTAQLQSLSQELSHGQRQQQRQQLLKHELQPRLSLRQQLDGQLPLLQQDQEQAFRQLQAAREQMDLLNQWIRRRQAEEQLAGLELKEQRLKQIELELQQLPPITPERLEQLRRLESELQTNRAVVSSLATGIKLLQAGAEVQLDGVPLQVGEARELNAAALLRLIAAPGLELRITPGGGASMGDARGRLQRAEAQLQAEYQQLQIESVAKAAAFERQRSELLQERSHLQREGLAEQRLRCEQELDGLAAVPPDQGSRAQLEEQRSQLVPRGKQLNHQEAEARKALDLVRRQRQELEQGLEEDQRELVQAETLLAALQQRHGGVDKLADQLAALQQEQRCLEQQRQPLMEKLQALAPAQALAADPHQLQQRRQELLQLLAANEVRLQVDGNTNLQAQREICVANLEACRGQRQGLEQQARMFNLLKSLLEQQQTTMGLHYTEPLRQRLEAYLAALGFAGGRTGLQYSSSGGFSELSWQRGEGVAWGFESLSGGTRELLAAALRLAMAEVLAQAYDGCLPVLFDDAFTNVDPSRWPGLRAMLQRAADQGLQLLLLSCDAAATAGLDIGERYQLKAGSAQV
jgi:hypothetical protein